jgi:hypothetical protein
MSGIHPLSQFPTQLQNDVLQSTDNAPEHQPVAGPSSTQNQNPTDDSHAAAVAAFFSQPLPTYVQHDTSQPGPPPPSYSDSTGGANPAVAGPSSERRGLGNLFSRTPDKVQSDRNHKLRHSIAQGDLDGIGRRLDKGADPLAPSSVKQQNAFHKAANSPELSTRMTSALVNAATDPQLGRARASLGQAAVAKDTNGNTPIHLAEYNLGRASALGDQRHVGRLTNLKDTLVNAAVANQHDVNSLENSRQKTPTDMYNEGVTAGQQELDLRARMNNVGL